MKIVNYSKAYMLLFLFVSCFDANTSNEKSNIQNSQEEIRKDSVNAKNGVFKLISGKYSETSIALDSNKNITGVYEYYDAWDEQFKEYTQICRFYFYGKYMSDTTIFIDAGWPDSQQRLKGKVKVSSSNLSVVLNDIPDGYAAVDFTEEYAYNRKLDEKKDWIQIRLVKSSKAKLYQKADSSSVRKEYIIKNDVVKVIEKDNKWCKIEYSSHVNNLKTVIAWMHEDDLYDLNPNNW